MKQLLQQYAAYNLWANKIMIEKISQLDEEIINKEVQSSFTSLCKTILHLWDVESVWWQRLKLVEHVIWPARTFEGNFQHLTQQFLLLSKQWYDWVSNANEINFTHVFEYRNSKKELFKQPVFDVLMHLFNHQTYHRGQLVTMMHELDIKKIPATDFIVFSRNKLSTFKKL